MIDGIRDLLADEGFRTGFEFGLLAVVAVMVVTAVDRHLRPWAGIAFVAAGLLAIDDAFTVERELLVGLGVLAAGGFLATRFPPLLWAVAAVPGAVLFTRATDLDEPSWAFATILAATLVGGLLMADFDRAFRCTGLPPVLLAVSLLGVYLTTPETQHSILLTGAALPIALLGWPWPLGSLGVGGSFAVTALVTWTVVLDGSFRPSSVVGGIASLGMFAIEPSCAGRSAGPRPARSWPWPASIWSWWAPARGSRAFAARRRKPWSSRRWSTSRPAWRWRCSSAGPTPTVLRAERRLSPTSVEVLACNASGQVGRGAVTPPSLRTWLGG